jgi:hypothetical protein
VWNGVQIIGLEGSFLVGVLEIRARRCLLALFPVILGLAWTKQVYWWTNVDDFKVARSEQPELAPWSPGRLDRLDSCTESIRAEEYVDKGNDETRAENRDLCDSCR